MESHSNVNVCSTLAAVYHEYRSLANVTATYWIYLST